MNAFGELTASFAGWSEIIAGKAQADRHFVPTRRGLMVAVLWFVVAMLLASAVQSAGAFPSPARVLSGLIAELVTLALVGVAVQQGLRRLQVAAPTERLLVPVTYALAYMFVVSIPLLLIGTGPALLALFTPLATPGENALLLLHARLVPAGDFRERAVAPEADVVRIEAAVAHAGRRNARATRFGHPASRR